MRPMRSMRGEFIFHIMGYPGKARCLTRSLVLEGDGREQGQLQIESLMRMHECMHMYYVTVRLSLCIYY